MRPARTISVPKIVERARYELAMVDQWRGSRDPANVARLSYATQHACKAEALIALLEIALCGRVGGYAPEQTHDERASLEARLSYAERMLR